MAVPFSPSLPLPPRGPRFLPHTVTEAARHASYLLVTVVAWPSAKSAFVTTVEWHTRAPLPPSFSAPVRPPAHTVTDAAPQSPRAPAPGPESIRVRTLVEREPLNAAQARERAGALALRNGIPVVFTVGC